MLLKLSRGSIILAGMLVLLLLLAGCFGDGGDLPAPTSSHVSSTPQLTQDLETPVVPIVPSTPTPAPRRLTICISEEPETLFIYGGDSLAQRHLLQAIYDGPIDRVGYQDQPVILEKLPSLSDGDAALEPVPVAAGDLVVNAAGQAVQLELGEIIKPFGCTSADCAVSWDGSPLELPQLSATFTIKPGIKWSDGTPLTAGDSVYSYQVATQCESDFGGCGGLGLADRNGWEMLPRTAGYTTLDEYRLQWTGIPGFLDPAYQTNFFIPLPEHQLSTYQLQDLFTAPEAAREPLGWGAYVLQSWVPGDSISLRANPLYFRAEEAGVKFDELLFRFIGQELENINLVPNGYCDLMDQSASQIFLDADLGEINQLQENGQLQAYFAAGPVWEHLDFGIQPVAYDDGYQPGVDRPDFFRDFRTRQAFAWCMDREAVVSQVLEGLSSVPASYLPEGHPLHNSGLAPYEYDPSVGEQLLQAAGWVDHDADPQTPRQAVGIQGILDGTPLVVRYTTSQSAQHQATSEILARSLAECGIQVDLVSGPAGEVYAPGPDGPVFGRQFDLAQFAWSASYQAGCRLWTSDQVPGDPILEDENGQAIFPYGWGGVNETGFRNSEFDRACEQAIGTLPGQPGNLENHYLVQSIFTEHLPVIPLYQHLSLALSGPDFCGFSLDPSAYSEFWNIEAYDRSQGCP